MFQPRITVESLPVLLRRPGVNVARLIADVAHESSQKCSSHPGTVFRIATLIVLAPDAELVKWDLVMFGTVDETTQYGGGHNSALTARSLTHMEGGRGGAKTAPLHARLASILLPMLMLLLRL